MLHSVATGASDHDTDRKAAQILLEFDALVRGQEDREAVVGRHAEEFAISHSAPALRRDRRDLETHQRCRQLARQGLV